MRNSENSKTALHQESHLLKNYVFINSSVYQYNLITIWKYLIYAPVNNGCNIVAQHDDQTEKKRSQYVR